MATKFSQYRAVAPALVEQRAATRHRILVTRATLTKRGNKPVEAMLHDLSVYGCRLACEAPHGTGDKVWLNLPDGAPVPATVVWNNGTHIGCRFDEPIERSLVRQLTLVIR
ncbi:PilZ domain-containing protein [Sphingomonas sp. NIBR02145]|uniref:PilZ domain-containing protein n=1 Tax=Sphingomonas sp. NIBR02145 TaxID=3014784 RepID=UPI0022B415B3|nr:PilZ domain-containing protein [Sphingomonas sp. NIBR02145]WHU00788.1 PilZ domain-containing protein [Sphingomonas sp. NIBR02145]